VFVFHHWGGAVAERLTRSLCERCGCGGGPRRSGEPYARLLHNDHWAKVVYFSCALRQLSHNGEQLETSVECCDGNTAGSMKRTGLPSDYMNSFHCGRIHPWGSRFWNGDEHRPYSRYGLYGQNLERNTPYNWIPCLTTGLPLPLFHHHNIWSSCANIIGFCTIGFVLCEKPLKRHFKTLRK